MNINQIQVMVLNDGQTYTTLRGCRVMWIPAETPEHEVDFFVKKKFHDPDLSMSIEGILDLARVRVE